MLTRRIGSYTIRDYETPRFYAHRIACGYCRNRYSYSHINPCPSEREKANRGGYMQLEYQAVVDWAVYVRER